MLHRIHRFGLGVVLLALAVLPAAADVRETRSFSTDRLEVRNLIGEIKVERGGGTFEVEILIQGKDASKDLVQIVSEEGTNPKLTLVFPKQGRFIYPRLGANSRSSFSIGKDDGDSWLGHVIGALTGHDRIEVRGSGSGIEVWADLTIRVPSGGTLAVRHGVGHVGAAGVSGNVDLEVRSGHVTASEIDGRVAVDTGSGHVEVNSVRGDVAIDTGSGHVQGKRLSGGRVEIDTGSGHVELDGIETTALLVDTGSGHVTAVNVTTDSASIDTGSGGVELELDAMGQGDFDIDTGSGGIELYMPGGAAVDVKASTGSGGVQVDLGDEVKMRRKERDEVWFTTGDGGSRVALSTGSGGIRIGHSR